MFKGKLCFKKCHVHLSSRSFNVFLESDRLVISLFLFFKNILIVSFSFWEGKASKGNKRCTSTKRTDSYNVFFFCRRFLKKTRKHMPRL